MLETSPAPATLLLDVNLARLLGAFREPRTAAEAARALGEPANRIGHRVRKLRDAGLLREVARKGRKVYLQARLSSYAVIITQVAT
jgi:DNA-binding transcriptional ArsR family regulator